MRFYERLYVGDEAKKRRSSIIQAVREGKKTGYWILTLPSNGKNLLDLYPAMALAQPYYKEKDMLILGSPPTTTMRSGFLPGSSTRYTRRPEALTLPVFSWEI